MRKSKEIERHFKEKINDWLFTLTGTSLLPSKVDSIRNSLYVSGGSIVSLLLGEEINDYDIFLDDVDLMHDLVSYYLGRYTEGTNLKKDTFSIHKEYLTNLAQYNLGNPGTIEIKVKNNEQKNINHNNGKFYGKKITDNWVKPTMGVYSPIVITSRAITLSDGIQLCFRLCGKPRLIHKFFDFDHCMNHWNYKEGLVLKQEALASIVSKELKYNSTQFPINTLFRLQKFMSRGWTFPRSEAVKLAYNLSQLNLSDMDAFKHELNGYADNFLENLTAEDLQDKNQLFQKIDKYIL